MARFLIYHSHTLYAKSTIPVAIALAEAGHEVTFLVNRPTLAGRSLAFSERRILRRPTSVCTVVPESLAFVADLIGYGDRWQVARGTFRFSRSCGGYRFDAAIGTTKDLPWLGDISSSRERPTFALGYQHIPFVLKVGAPFATYSDAQERKSLFLNGNPFAARHAFARILSGHGLKFSTFPHLDQVYRSGKHKSPETFGKNVLVFHPGGYRNMISAPNAGRDECLRAQRGFLERVCLPLVNAGLTPVVKIHPLRARYHDLADVEVLVEEIAVKHGLAPGCIQCMGPTEWSWDCAYGAAFNLTFGSSSIYEHWAAGIRNTYVCNFEGNARSERFGFFRSLFLDTHEDFRSMVATGSWPTASADPFTDSVMKAYAAGFNGRATEDAVALIEQELAA